MKFFLFLAFLFLPLTALPAPVINEFVADNAGGLTDVDGDASDWIEIHNPDAAAVDLTGWHLTDNATNLTKWTFPAVSIPAGGYLVVFASSKDRAVAGQELHTNFALNANGEYLALVQPGETIASHFSPTFPSQRAGYSYGTAQSAQAENLTAGVTPNFLVPTSAGALAADWKEPTMASPAGWQNGGGSAAVGYETATPPATSNIAPSGTATQSTTSFPATNGNNGIYTDFTHTVGSDASPSWRVAFTEDKHIYRVKFFNRTTCCGSRMRDITVKILDAANTVVFSSALLNPENAGFSYPNGPGSLEVDLVAVTGGPVTGRTVRLERTPDPDLSGTGGQGNADEANVLSLAEVEVHAAPLPAGDIGYFIPLISTDVKAAMHTVNSSAFVRYPFQVSDPSSVAALKLRLRYDDGFIAYLNGVKIAERSAPVAPAWNSAASGPERSDSAAVQYEEIEVSAFANALVAGTNVLAIQGLTTGPSDPDFLLQPELHAQRSFPQPVYLREPTPGAGNVSSAFLAFVGDTSFTLKRGFYSSPQTCAISTSTTGASIYYTTNGADPTPTTGTLYTGPVPITQTTVLRARAFKPDWEPTNVDTQTYVFLADVIAQQTNGAPPPGWPTSPVANSFGQSQQLNYGMDPNVRALYGDAQLFAGLTQLPTISIVTEQANLTDGQTGIYTNAAGHGDDWERPASIEWIDPAKPAGAQGEFQHDCGLRIRGGFSRNPDFVKHSLRVYFRKEYGVGKLDYPIFGDRGTREHDVIDLASSQNYSWARDTSGQDTMVRDPFARETLLATGSPACRNRYVHLYLNGIYWGLYYFDERVSAGYGEAYFGGKKEDYDVIKTGNHSQGFVTEATSGYMDTLPEGGPAAWRDLWNKHRAFATAPNVTQAGNSDTAAYFTMLGRNADGTRNPALPVLVDVDSLIDYMLVIFYSGDGDAPLSNFLQNNRANNWFALKSRNDPERGFMFFNHDAEHTFGAGSSQNDRTGPFNGTNQTNFIYSNPQWIFQDLAFSPEFRLRVADRAYKHFFNSGAMTTATAQARMDALAAQINLAVKAHSQRWGDTKKTPAFNATDWLNAVNVARNWINGRENTIVQQLKNYRLTTSYLAATAPLFPNTPAPLLSHPGGTISPGQQISISGSGGTIYFTTNGDDPRAVGGAIAGTTYSGPISLTQPITTVKARVRSAGGEWSALAEATYTGAAVEITQQPVGKTVNPGQSIVLSVEATGAPQPTYQWRKDGGIIDGATDPTLTIPVAAEEHEGDYDVIVSNAWGDVPSLSVSVLVNDPVVITAHPVGGSANPGQPVHLSVTATGTGPISYQWRKGGEVIPDATASTYAIVSATEEDEGTYDVVVTNVVGSVQSNPAAVSVNNPVEIVSGPSNQAVNPGGDASFSVAVSGTRPFSYQWRKDGDDLEGATNASLTIEGVTPDHVGSYDVVVTGATGSITSATAQLTLNEAVTIVGQPKPVAVSLTGQATFGVAVAGTGPFTYQWRKGGADLVGATNATLQIARVSDADLGSYDVVVTNLVNSVTSASAELSLVDWEVSMGNYQGLLAGPDLNDPAAHPRPGRVTVKVNKKGKFTGKLEYLGVALGFKGEFDASLEATVVVGLKTPQPITLDVWLDAATHTIEVKAAQSLQQSDAVLAKIPARAKSAPVLKMGRYTLLLEPGLGAPTDLTAPGYLTLNVSKTGVAKWAGKLPDAGVLRGSAWLTSDDELAFYSSLYAKKAPFAGHVAGPMAIVASEISGGLGWRKPPQSKGSYWPGGFQALLAAEGGLHIKPAKNVRTIPVTDLLAALAGPVSGGGLNAQVQLSVKNQFLVQGFNPEKLKLNYNVATGLMKGSFFDSALRKTRKLEGVLLQGEDRAGGFFLGAESSGSWHLAAPTSGE